jgi:hypothetical protein
MREKRRKIPLDVILATPVSEARRKHGMQVYAARLCHRGQYDKAKEYCTKNNLSWPPFSGVPTSSPEAVSLMQSPPAMATGGSGQPRSASGEPLSDGAREAGPVAREEVKPQEVASIGVLAPSEPIAGVASGAAGEPPTGVRQSAGIGPHESRAPASPPSRRAVIWCFCPNPKLIRIKFQDGAQEFGSLWATRGGFRLNEVLTVELERGEGVNAIWEEKRRPV